MSAWANLPEYIRDRFKFTDYEVGFGEGHRSQIELIKESIAHIIQDNGLVAALENAHFAPVKFEFSEFKVETIGSSNSAPSNQSAFAAPIFDSNAHFAYAGAGGGYERQSSNDGASIAPGEALDDLLLNVSDNDTLVFRSDYFTDASEEVSSRSDNTGILALSDFGISHVSQLSVSIQEFLDGDVNGSEFVFQGLPVSQPATSDIDLI